MKRARENALSIAMEKSARLMLKERKYESNTKRHQKMVKEEDDYRNEKFQSLAEQRKQKRQTTIEHDEYLDKLGYDRYKKDNRTRESDIARVKERDLMSARDSFLKLRVSMELTERKQKQAIENFNRSALEAKKTLHSIERDANRKQEAANRTIEKVREKCMNQFETQRNIYRKYEDISDRKLLNHSEKVYNKFNLTQQKSRDLNERTNMTVDYHKQKNTERFYTRDEGLKRAAD